MQVADTTAAVVRQTTESVWQLGAYVAVTIGVFVFFGFLIYRKAIPKWIKDAEDRSLRDKEREEWARAQVSRAQDRLDQTYDKIPHALSDIATRMEEGNRLNREAFTKLFDQNTRILERLPWPDVRETGGAGKLSR